MQISTPAALAPEIRGLIEPGASSRNNSIESPVEIIISAYQPFAQAGAPATSNLLTASTSVAPMSAGRSVPLLVCSIGNPGFTYANTLHSIGHTVVQRIQERLGYPIFQRDRRLGNGLVSSAPSAGEGGDWTFWQSTSYMNESGKGVREAWSAWSRAYPDGDAKLVVVHDELEKPLGKVSLKTDPAASAKGHNGLKSIKAVAGNLPYARIGIGIDRPASRAPDEVTRYVLRKMTPTEKTKIDACVDEVIAKLRQLSNG